MGFFFYYYFKESNYIFQIKYNIYFVLTKKRKEINGLTLMFN